MLNGKLTLHDIRDVEAFTAALLPPLEQQEREDLHAYLIAEAWELSQRYEPGGISFSTWARTTLTRRVHDWRRHTQGRTRWQFAGGRVYERELPTYVEFTDSTPGMDPQEHRDPPGERLDGEGTISPLAYLPPGGFTVGSGVCEPLGDGSDRGEDEGSEAA